MDFSGNHRTTGTLDERDAVTGTSAKKGGLTEAAPCVADEDIGGTMGLQRSSTLNKIQNYYHNGNYQQNMNQTPHCIAAYKPEQPENQ